MSLTLSDAWQHINGNHTHYGVANIACAYTAGDYDPNYGLYRCIGHGTSTIPTHTSNDTGSVNPTFIGQVAAVHYAGGVNENGCTNNGYGDISVPATMVATAGECKIGDGGRYTDSMACPNGSCTNYVQYTHDSRDTLNKAMPTCRSMTCSSELGSTGDSLSVMHESEGRDLS